MSILDTGLWRRNRIRLVRQTEMAECGLAVLVMVGNYHGLKTDIGTLRRQFQPSLRGAPLKTLISIADELGMTARAVKLPLGKLRDLHVPAVLHWDMNHFVVLERVAGGKALIHNPEGTSRWMPLDEVSPHFTGVALELRPADDFQPLHQREHLKLSQLWRRITGFKRAVLQTIILSMVLEAFVLASPYYMQVGIDRVLPALDYDLLTVLATGFGLFTMMNAGASLLRSFVLLSAGTSIGFGISANLARRLFRLPVSWFEKRHIGDILSRFQSVSPLQQFMTQGAISTIIDGSLTIFTLALMLFYSPILTIVAVVAFAFYAMVRLLSFAAQRQAQEETIIAAGKEQSMMIESLRGIVTLRLFNREIARHALWQTRLMDSINAAFALGRIGVWQSTANTLIFGLETVVSIWLAVRLCMAGGFSVGMVYAFMAYKTQFLQRGASLIDQAITFRMLGLHLERLSDIANSDQDVSVLEKHLPHAPLRGKVELRSIRYRYSPSDPLVLDGINLVIEPGEHIAITGPSGGGKSTLVKIILSLVEPDDGELLIDDVPLSRYGYKNYRSQIAAVLQDDSLFAGSLADNIALFDDDVDMTRVIAAAEAAALHDDIALMPMAYDTLVGDMGSSLSGGQRQRLLLARALYRQPRVLLMDEGTSHLDAAREQLVNEGVAKLGITRIIVAHRLETIVAASRIIAINNGRAQDVTEHFGPLKRQLLGASQ